MSADKPRPWLKCMKSNTSYGQTLYCTKSEGHDGDHMNFDSLFAWPAEVKTA